MVISKWTKVYSNGDSCNGLDLFYPFKYVPFIEGWARVAFIDGEKIPISLAGVTCDSDNKILYRSYVFERVLESCLNKNHGKKYNLSDTIQNGIDLVFNTKSFISKDNVYEVMLKADIKLKDLGVKIDDLDYKIKGKHV